jgi:oligopeptide/dipeptide ABC transporter ATP-binding protein
MPTMRSATDSGELLKVLDLTVHFPTYGGLVRAVEGVNLDVHEQEIVGLIGETGCGKTVTGYSLLRLVQPPGRIVRGQVVFRGRDLLSLSEREVRGIRGREISMIFQRPMSSLNPVFAIGDQLLDVVRLHRTPDRKKAREIVLRSLSEVALPDPESIMAKRPFKLSGGMQQRVMIAMALACGASLLIADEPTTALDVSIQLQILKLILKIVEARKLSVLLISHDMSLIGSMCERINVMYAGSIIESGPKSAIIGRPAHPYTRALLQAVPEMSQDKAQRLQAIDGTVPSLIRLPEGCRFAPRCPRQSETCRRSFPARVPVGPDHYVHCYLGGEGVERGAGGEFAQGAGQERVPEPRNDGNLRRRS